jgi:predicted nucleic acid-binding protein
VPFVVDASVTACWFFPDEDHPDAEAAWLRMEADYALVPEHWWFEIRNTMLVPERRGRSAETQTNFALHQLSRLKIRFAPQPEESAVFALARRYRLTFYDAAYLELALQHEISLATLDHALAAAAQSERIDLITAS